MLCPNCAKPMTAGRIALESPSGLFEFIFSAGYRSRRRLTFTPDSPPPHPVQLLTERRPQSAWRCNTCNLTTITSD